MTLNELDAMLSEYLKIADFPGDPSKNGLQVENLPGPDGNVRTMAFAVDACLETVERAALEGADLLFVHHGLLWGGCEPVIGPYFRRLKALFERNMALYACHLPLDAHRECGNNFGLAARLGLDAVEPCCEWRGYVIGALGSLAEPLTPDQVIDRLFPAARAGCTVLPFGKPKAARVAIVSGGGGDETAQAAKAGADLFITGELSHTQYHTAEELGITVIAAGHYLTETVGPELLRQKIARETNIKTVFIDVPTGM